MKAARAGITSVSQAASAPLADSMGPLTCEVMDSYLRIDIRHFDFGLAMMCYLLQLWA